MKKKLISLLLCFAMQCVSMFAVAENPAVTGKVIEVDKFGHARLDITIEEFNAAGFELGDIVTVKTGTFEGDMPCFDGFYVESGEYMVRAQPGDETISVCINYGNFAEAAGISPGDEVTITLKEKAGALTTQRINSLVYTNEPTDYDSDEVFANFRPVTVGDIGEGKLYYKDLAQNGHVIALGMSINFASDGFAEMIVKGLTFLSGQETPYLIHCTEGKDRAGFGSMIAEGKTAVNWFAARFKSRIPKYLHLSRVFLQAYRSVRPVHLVVNTGCPLTAISPSIGISK